MRLLGTGDGRCLDVGCGTGVATAVRGRARLVGNRDRRLGGAARVARRARARGGRGERPRTAVRGRELRRRGLGLDAHGRRRLPRDRRAEIARVLRPGAPFVYIGGHPCFVGPHSLFVHAEGTPSFHPGYRAEPALRRDGTGGRRPGRPARQGRREAPHAARTSCTAFTAAELRIERFEEPERPRLSVSRRAPGAGDERRGRPGRSCSRARSSPTWSEVPARDAVLAPLPEALHPRVREALAAQGVEALYAHQAEAWEAAARGEHFVVTTGTASGKTLAFNLPVLDALAREPKQRALYLYPTKALAQDQLRALRLVPAAQAAGRDLRRRHRRRPALAGAQVGEPDPLQPGHAPRRRAAAPRPLGRRALEPRLRDRRRGARLPRRLRLARRQRAAAAAAARAGLRRRPAVPARLGDDREPRASSRRACSESRRR